MLSTETRLLSHEYRELRAANSSRLNGIEAMQPELSEANEQMAKYIAMVVRNAIEGFHCEHLTDEQMKLRNPLIRNAVATALHAFDHYERSGAARDFADYHCQSIPSYWEKPELLEGYVKMWQRRGEKS